MGAVADVQCAEVRQATHAPVGAQRGRAAFLAVHWLSLVQAAQVLLAEQMGVFPAQWALDEHSTQAPLRQAGRP
jgi:hypothetical protein